MFFIGTHIHGVAGKYFCIVKFNEFLKFKPMNLTNHIERIVQKSEDSKLTQASYNSLLPNIKPLAEFLNCSRDQAFLFALVFYFTIESGDADLSSMAHHLDIPIMRLLRFKSDLDALTKRRLIRQQEENHIFTKVKQNSYYVHHTVVSGLIKRKLSTHAGNIKTSIDFIVRLMEEMETAQEDKVDELIVQEDFVEICRENTKLFIAKKLLYAKEIADLEKMILVFVAGKMMEGEDETNLSDALGFLDRNKSLQFNLRRSVLSGENKLIKLELVKTVAGMFRSQEVSITEKGLEFLLGKEAEEFAIKAGRTKTELPPQKIAPVKLFLNAEESKQVQTLEKVLSKKKFAEITRQMKQKKMNTGFTILLHGAPGTGKTESVYQLARKTGRSIFPVDISSTKSSWFGESEKLIKNIFDQYRQNLIKQPLHPILLFNEADGIFSSRSKKIDSAVTQTLNTMQNIILQEMEDFEGIMIATTNLTENLDKAFDRRFLYKIRFDVPNAETRIRIMQDKLPSLPPDAIGQLCERYRLTGGQMANIAKKCNIYELLNGKPPGLEEIENFCTAELGLQQKGKLGF